MNRIFPNIDCDLACSCGCKGWWDLCSNNKANRDSFCLSPPPSPHREDNDWFIREFNPVRTYTSVLSSAPNIPPTIHHRISAQYVSDCVERYFKQ